MTDENQTPGIEPPTQNPYGQSEAGTPAGGGQPPVPQPQQPAAGYDPSQQTPPAYGQTYGQPAYGQPASGYGYGAGAAPQADAQAPQTPPQPEYGAYAPAYGEQQPTSDSGYGPGYAAPGYGYGVPQSPYAQPGPYAAPSQSPYGQPTGYYGAAYGMSDSDRTLRLVAFVLNIVGCVLTCWLVIPLAWGIPMTIHSWNIYKGTRANTVAFAVCDLLFLNLVSGILLLVSTKDA